MRTLVSSRIRFSWLVLTLIATSCGRTDAGFTKIEFSARGGADISADTSADRELQLNYLFQSVEDHYAPLQLKQDRFGFAWATLREETRASAMAAPTEREFYGAIQRMAASLRDAHVSVTLPSSAAVSLPLRFAFDHTTGKTVVAFIDRDKLPLATFGARLGDELILFDGRTPEQTRAATLATEGVGNAVTDLSLQTSLFTKRREARGADLPVGDTAVLRIAGSEGTRDYTLRWERAGTTFAEHSAPPATSRSLALTTEQRFALEKERAAFETPAINAALREAERVLALQNQLVNLSDLTGDDGASRAEGDKPNHEGTPTAIGYERPRFRLPASFEEIGHTYDFGSLLQGKGAGGIFAGTFRHSGKTVGYVRISTYAPEDFDLVDYIRSVNWIFSQLAKTDVLLIDQTGNGGGYVMLSDFLVSYLTNSDFNYRPMTFRVKPTLSWLRQYRVLRDLMSQNLTEADLLTKTQRDAFLARVDAEFNKVKAARDSGAALSEPVSLGILSEYIVTLVRAAIDKAIPPGPDVIGSYQRFTMRQPKYMLIDELCFSGGDATPAVLKDNGAVTLIGMNTAGAGGSVGSYRFALGTSRFDIRLTQSLMVRPNGKLVENDGVAPDVTVTPSINDLKNEYRDYLGEVLSHIR